MASRFALVLNAPQLLQASTDTTAPEEPALGFLALAADGFLAGALALVFFAMAALAMNLHASQRAGDRLKAEPAALQKLGEHSLASGLKDTSKQRAGVARPKHPYKPTRDGLLGRRTSLEC